MFKRLSYELLINPHVYHAEGIVECNSLDTYKVLFRYVQNNRFNSRMRTGANRLHQIHFGLSSSLKVYKLKTFLVLKFEH